MPYSNPPLPAGIFSGGNERLDTRQLGQMMFAEQRQRQMQQAKESSELDASMQKEAGKMRGVDQPAFLDKAAKWKAAQQSLLFDKRLQQDPKAFAQRQMEARSLYNDAMTHAASSADLKEQAKQLLSEQRTAPDRFHDDFYGYMGQFNKTPMERLQSAKVGDQTVDLSDPQSYVHQGPDKSYYEGIEKTRGTLLPTGYEDKKSLDAKGLQYEVTPYSYGNKPDKHFHELMNFYAQPGQARKAAYEAEQLTPEEFQSALQKYQSTPKDKLARVGLKELPDLTPHNPHNKAEVMASYHAMQTFNDQDAVPQKKEYRTNEAMKMQMEAQKQRENTLLTHGLRQQEIKLAHSLTGKSAADQQSSLDAYLKGNEERAKKGTPISINHNDGSKTVVYPMDVSPSLLKSFEKEDMYGQKTQPDVIAVGGDGKHYPIFYKRQTKDVNGKTEYTGDYKRRSNGDPIVDINLTKPVSRDVTKGELANIMLSPKMTAENLGYEDGTDNGDGASSAPTAAPSKPSAPAKTDKKIESLRSKYKY